MSLRSLCALATFLATALLAAASSQAEVKLHRLFSDNCVLQRDTKVTVWGTADRADTVMVAFGDQKVSATPKDGAWQVELAPMEASATARDLTVSQGDEKIVRKNVLVGDVWLCGGQSNMQWEVRQSAGKEEAISAATNPQIRLFTVERKHKVEKPQADLGKGSWAEASPESVTNFSAVGYFFGRDVQKALSIPIGLISSNIGGTTAERWVSAEAIDSNENLKGMTTPQGRNDLYNAMIAPLAPFAIKGAIWYQGESNGDRPYHYRHVLSALIQDWRKTFRSDLPFFMVELAPFTVKDDPTGERWAVVRESQQLVAKELPKVDTVSIVDVGHKTNIHPQQKQPVGERLATAALVVAYGKEGVPAGPEFESLTIRNDAAVVKLKNVGQGLVAKDGDLKGFTLAGEDKKFHEAKAKIEGDTIVVTAEGVTAPKAVRFGWNNFPEINLWNKDGLPASPFRTDDWEVAKQNAK